MTLVADCPWYVRLESPDGDRSWLCTNYGLGPSPFCVTEDPDRAHGFDSRADANAAIEAYGLLLPQEGSIRAVQWQDEP